MEATSSEVLPVIFVLAVPIATSLPLGLYMARVFSGQRTFLDFVLAPVERVILSLAAINTTQGMDWKRYSSALLLSNACMWIVSFLVVSFQGILPLNPDGIAGMEATLAFHTITSFVTNTNLQHYSGETGLSYLSQMIVITFLQFMTAAAGIAAAIAIVRALGGNGLETLGNFYLDTTRAAVRVLLPLAVVVAAVLMSQGAPMTFEGAERATTLEGAEQIIARGPVAAEVAIKQLGTNGGGYFGPNSTHPYENPTPLSNLLENWSILAIPMAMVVTVAAMLRRWRLGVMLFATMLALYLPLVSVAVQQETSGSMEGKEVRIGAAASAFWAASTTATSNGSINAMHDSLAPLSGLVLMIGMWLNNIFGGVGVGFINMLVYVVVTAFVAGMMVGRTPELLGKKVEAHEVKLASLVLVLHPLLILGGTAVACTVWVTTVDPGTTLAWLKNPGPHGFSEMLYEFSSASANNGSGFEGLGDNTSFWNLMTGLAMLLGRYIPIIAPLALAASLGRKVSARQTEGTLSTDTFTFGFTLWAVVVIVGVLTFMPAAVLGPIGEHLSMTAIAK
ncbi:MAG TPA: potassium-transporting ATPase subunit KdpA [Vicinamibacteria bacterium]|nr:potassium-transporting ATPase subunit KdpA [Vicinamibacteria bacterium]